MWPSRGIDGAAEKALIKRLAALFKRLTGAEQLIKLLRVADILADRC